MLNLKSTGRYADSVRIGRTGREPILQIPSFPSIPYRLERIQFLKLVPPIDCQCECLCHRY